MSHLGKPLNKVSVLVAAANLMAVNGTATTLEVKNELRNQGFEARQSEVSQFMSDLADEEKWNVNNGGSYRVYAPGTVSSKVASKTSTPTVKVPATELSSPIKGCWEVNSVTSSNVKYYDVTGSRSAVRWAFAKTSGSNFADTRARKIK